jgi:2-oxoglutarate ferredoxin oxidoreductase subunit beta
VARTIDSDRKHLTGVLRAAADHKGAAFVEIYQNCPIFNDDAFLPVTQPGSRDQHVIRLEHGEPVRFGAENGTGLRFSPYGSLEPVPVAGAAPETLLTHDAHVTDPSYAFALSRLDDAGFEHAPIGVFRQVPRPSYDELMSAQIEQAREQQGDGDLAALLAGPDTWQVG